MSEIGLLGVSRKAELYDRLLQSIDQRFGSSDSVRPLGEWAASVPIVLDGKPFTFERHEYLIDPYADTHPYQVEEKAAQLGLTSKAMLKAIHSARYRNYRGILYLFPNKTDVTDFSKGRIDPLINDNSETIGKWLKDTDSANIKRIWNCFLYLRGMTSRVGLKSVPADFIIFDELD